jgi:hypothetical protein
VGSDPYIYHFENPQVQAFIPLAADGRDFNVAGAIRFPLTLYAAQLAADGKLAAQGGRIDWLTHNPGERERRWFNLMPPEPLVDDELRSLTIDLEVMQGRRSLSFLFRVEPIPGHPFAKDPVHVMVAGMSSGDGGATIEQPIAELDSASRGSPVDTPFHAVELPLGDELQAVTISFAPIRPIEMVRVVELRLSADDVTPTAAEHFCR